MLPAHANRLERLLDRMAPLGATLCVIDTAPHSGGDAFTVATLVDHILIPVQPSAPDLRAIHQTIRIAESAGTPATVVVNRALVNHPTIAQSHRSPAGPPLVASRLGYTATETPSPGPPRSRRTPFGSRSSPRGNPTASEGARLPGLARTTPRSAPGEP